MKNKTFYLMHKDIPVLEVEIFISYEMLSFGNVKIINKKHLPFLLRNKNNNIKEWFINRFPTIKTNNVFKIIDMINYNCNDKKLTSLYTLSFANYCTSLNDKYWLNPKEEYIIKNSKQTNGMINDFVLVPTTWNNINYIDNKFDTTIGNIIENIYYNQKIELNKINYISPDLILLGKKNKRYIIKDNEISVKKFLKIKDMEKRFKIYNELKQINNIFLLEQKFDFDNEYILSKYFLKENEEYVDGYAVISSFLKKYKGQDKFEFLKYCAIKLGCKKCEINEYLNTIKYLEQKLQIEYDETNIGFIKDVKTNKIIRCAPIR